MKFLLLLDATSAALGPPDSICQRLAFLDARKAVLTLVLLVLLPFNSAVAEVHWVSRPDPMHSHWLMDSDRQGDVVRVLYKTMPSLEQSASGNWNVNVYVAELHPDGRIENRLLQTGQRHFSALLLQRGGDGVFAVVTPAHGESTVKAEFWSATDGSLVSSFESVVLKRVSTTMQIFPTADGNFFYVLQSAQSARGNQPNTLSWKKISSQGETLATGDWSKPHTLFGLTGAFQIPDGGLGMVIGTRLTSDSQVLETDVEAVQGYEIAGRKIEARVFAETRLLVTHSSGEFRWLSSAIERELLWSGDTAISPTLPPNEMMAQNQQQMALMERVARENNSERRIIDEARFPFDEIQRTTSGYGMLVKVSADRKLNPPQHGMWYIEIGDDGSLLREQRIEPAAEQLEATFDRFMPTADNGLLVAGTRREGGHSLRLTALDANGEIEWTSRLGMQNAKIEGIGGTKEKPWVYGQDYNETESKNQLWAELIDPSSMMAVDAPPAAQASQPKPAPTREAQAPPTFEMPEPAEGCECSCEEFAIIQEITEKMNSASQAEVMALVSDPGYQKMMKCAGGCGMQYAQCR